MSKLTISVIVDGVKVAIGQMQDLKKSADDVGKNLVANSQKISDGFTKVGAGFTKAGTAMLPFSAASTAFLTKGVMGASDLTESINKTRVAFGASADAILSMADNSSVKFGETKSQVLDTASTFGLLGVEADKIPAIMQRIADVGSLQNRTFEEVSRDFISGFNGSTEAVEKYGIKLKVTDLAQYMVEQGMAANVKEAGKLMNVMDSSTKQQLFYSKILHDTANAEGDLANNSYTLAVRSKILKAQLSELATTLGQRLLPFAESAVLSLSNLVESIDSMPAEQINAIVKGLVALAGVAPGLLFLGKVFSIIGSAFGALSTISTFVSSLMAATGATSALGAVMATIVPILTGPVGIILAIVAVLGLLYAKFESVRNFVSAVFSGIGEVIQAVFVALSESVGGVSVSFDSFFKSIQPVVDIIFNLATNVFGVLVEILKVVLPVAIKVLVGAFKLIIDVVTVVANVVGFVFNVIVTIIQVAFAIVTAIFNVWFTVVSAIINALVSVFQVPFDMIVALVQVVLGVIQGIFEIWVSIISAIITTLVAIFQIPFNIIVALIQFALGVITAAFNVWFGVASTIVNTLVSVFSNVFNTISGVVSGVINTVTGIFKAFGNIVSGIVNGISTTFTNVFNGVVAFINGIKNKIVEIFDGIASGVGTAISGGVDALINSIKSVVNTLFIGPVNGAIGVLNKVPGVSIDELPMLAKGGIVNGPLNAIIGEAGPEAVIPLKQSVLGKIGQGIVEAGGAGSNSITNSGTVENNYYISGLGLSKEEILELLRKLLRESGR